MAELFGYPRRQFLSDTCAGVCPEAWAAMAEANAGHAAAYGEDGWTRRAIELVRETFETDCDVFFVGGGTVANALALSSICRPYHRVFCAGVAHVEVDECGAPEFFTGGAKVVSLETDDGKLDPEVVAAAVAARDDVHYPKAGAVSITQATEVGTVYTPDEVSAVAACAHGLGLRVHMDGARFANAVESLGATPASLTWRAGVDVLSFGGTKNGLPYGDAVVFFSRDIAREFEYRVKQAGQLAAKMRFITAPWVGLLETGAWRRNARRANDAASRLEAELKRVKGVTIVHPRQANSVFVGFSPGVREGLAAKGWLFHSIPGWGGSRLMCSWDTTDQDVADFMDDIASLSL